MFIVSDTKLNEISIAICASILVLVGISILFLIVLWYNDHFRKDFPKNGSTIWDTTLLLIFLFMILFVMVLTLLILEVKIKKEKDPNGKKKLQENAKKMRIVSSVYFGGLSIVIFIYFYFADNKKKSDANLGYIPYADTSNPKDNHNDKPNSVASKINEHDVLIASNRSSEKVDGLKEIPVPQLLKIKIRSYDPSKFNVYIDDDTKELIFIRLNNLTNFPEEFPKKIEMLPENLARIDIVNDSTIITFDTDNNQISSEHLGMNVTSK